MNSESDLERLDDLLLSLPEENEGMLLSEFDGFCAGLIVCPDLVLPREWVPLVWGDDITSPFVGIDEAQKATGLIMAHYNAVAQSLSPPI